MKTAINNAKINPKAMELMGKHYEQLHRELVTDELSDEIFNTTVLSISYRLDGDFIECFKKLYVQNYLRYKHERRIYEATHDVIDEDVARDEFVIDEEQHEFNFNNFINAYTEEIKRKAKSKDKL